MPRTGPKRADECAVRITTRPTTTRQLLGGVGRVRPSCGQQLRRPCPAGRPRPARAPQVTPPTPPGAGAAWIFTVTPSGSSPPTPPGAGAAAGSGFGGQRGRLGCGCCGSGFVDDVASAVAQHRTLVCCVCSDFAGRYRGGLCRVWPCRLAGSKRRPDRAVTGPGTTVEPGSSHC